MSASALLHTFLSTPVRGRVPRRVISQGAVLGSEARRDTPGAAIVAGRALVSHKTTALPDVMALLARNHFTGVPILDTQSHYVAWLNLLDIVRFCNSLFFGKSESEWATFTEGERFREATVNDVLQFNGKINGGLRSMLHAAQPVIFGDDTSFYAFESLLRPGNERLVVLHPTTREVESVVTQSMMISWLRQLRHLWPDTLRSMLVRDIRSDRTGVNCVRERDTALTAFNLLGQRGCGNLAIVDDAGILVGNISAKDLKGVGADASKFYRLFLGVKDYKDTLRSESPRQAPTTHYSKKPIPRRALYVVPEETMEDVIEKMNDGNIHHLFVCSSESDTAGKPIPQRVLSQRDVLRAVMNVFQKM